MTDVASVHLRNIHLAGSARILAPEGGPAEAESFVELEAPPPVGSVLTLVTEDGATRQVRVLHVVETGGAHGVAGVHVAPASEEDRQRAQQVGTEHLAPMERSRPQDDPSEARSDAPAAPEEEGEPAPQAGGFAVPAPVVEPEPSEAIDVGHPTQDPAEGPAAPERSGRSGKRRKGRRRG